MIDHYDIRHLQRAPKVDGINSLLLRDVERDRCRSRNDCERLVPVLVSNSPDGVTEATQTLVRCVTPKHQPVGFCKEPCDQRVPFFLTSLRQKRAPVLGQLIDRSDPESELIADNRRGFEHL